MKATPSPLLAILAPIEHIMSRRLGTDVAIWPRWRIFCLDCGTRIPYRALLRRTWIHTACRSCESYIEYIITGRLK